MNTTRFACLALLCLAFAEPAPALAQQVDNAQLFDRLDKLERDQMLLQRQLARGGPAPAGGPADTSMPAGGSNQLENRLTGIEEQIRDLRGKVEEADNHNRKLREDFDKLQKDVEFRLNELSSAHAQAAAAAPQPLPNATTTNAGGSAASSGTNMPTPLVPQASAPANDKGVAKEDPHSFSTPRELYNYAFRLLNQTQYEDAAAAFEVFTKKFPKDPLVGNAFYWGGETYYIRRDYINAADHFRAGFEAMPEGPKAADNLLKLAMSLNAVSRDKEACLVLQQVISKFKKTSSSVTDRAEQEQKRIGCKKA